MLSSKINGPQLILKVIKYKPLRVDTMTTLQKQRGEGRTLFHPCTTYKRQQQWTWSRCSRTRGEQVLFFLPRKRLGHSFLTSQIPPRTVRLLRKSFKWQPKLREMDRIHFLERSTKLQEAPRSQTPWSMPSESLISIKPKLLERAFKTWLPELVTVLRKRHVLEFLVFLRDNKKLLPRTILG